MYQLSIFLENSKGRLAEVLNYLSELNVNMRALSLADTKDYGVLRIMVDEPEEMAQKLRSKDCVVSLTKVWVLPIPDKVGGLAGVLNALVAKGVIIEYMYAFVEKGNEQAKVVLRVSDEEIMAEAVKSIPV